MSSVGFWGGSEGEAVPALGSCQLASVFPDSWLLHSSLRLRLYVAFLHGPVCFRSPSAFLSKGYCSLELGPDLHLGWPPLGILTPLEILSNICKVSISKYSHTHRFRVDVYLGDHNSTHNRGLDSTCFHFWMYVFHSWIDVFSLCFFGSGKDDSSRQGKMEATEAKTNFPWALPLRVRVLTQMQS